MSPPIERKPKSDTVYANNGRSPGGCDQLSSCPHGEVLRQMQEDQSETKGYVHELRDAIVGTADKPGLAEKMRSMDARIHAGEAKSKRQTKLTMGFIAAFVCALLAAGGDWVWKRITGQV